MFKKLTTLLAVGIIAIGFSFSAQAETLTFSAGVPVSYSADNIAGTDVSGTLLHVKFPSFVGFGFESYDVTTATGGYKTSMIDLFYLLPIPAVNVTLGVGAGVTEPTGGYKALYTKGAAAQAYLQLGWSFGVMDVHFSQHIVKSGLLGAGTLDTSGSMTAIGVQVGF